MFQQGGITKQGLDSVDDVTIMDQMFLLGSIGEDDILAGPRHVIGQRIDLVM